MSVSLQSDDGAEPGRLAADIERATLDAVPPTYREELQGWLLGIDQGTVWRAKSAAPLLHLSSLAESTEQVAARYRDAGLQPCFRLPDLPELQGVHTCLTQQAYSPGSATHVQWVDAAELESHLVAANIALSRDRSSARAPCDGRVLLSDFPDPAWCAVFLGDGFDPVDGASRTEILKRAAHACYASVQEEGRTVAVGMGSFSHGWASIHGMRTLPESRGRGHARSIIGRLLHEARRRQLGRLFLQVENANQTARSIYGSLGFKDLWTYRYWLPERSE